MKARQFLYRILMRARAHAWVCRKGHRPQIDDWIYRLGFSPYNADEVSDSAW